MTDLFITATRKQYRYPSEKGYLTTEQLWELPLTSRTKFDLNNVAIVINSQLKELAEESFVEVNSDPRRGELANQLEIVKYIIMTKQVEKNKATENAARAALKAQIQEAIEAKRAEALGSASLEELQAQLAALEAAW